MIHKQFCRSILFAAIILLAAVSFVDSQPLRALDRWTRQPVIVIPPVHDKAPVIDGHVKFKEWYYAADVASFYDPETGGLGKYPATMYLCYDNDALYVAMTIHRPPMNPTPKSTFAAGPHSSIWWKDDNIELVMEPGELGKSTSYGYVFAGNSVGGYSDLRYAQSSGSDAAWNGKWEYQASRGRDTWSFELKIPFSQFEGISAPQPGAEWTFDALIESVTPKKTIYDWSHMWSFGQDSYRSANKARLIFGDRNTPVFRLNQVGQMRVAGKSEKLGIVPIGMRAVLYHQGDAAYTLNAEAVLYRADARKPGDLNYLDLWDRLLTARETGKPITDPNETTQSFRDEASFLKELNSRYKLVKKVAMPITVKPNGAGYVPLEAPKEPGDYVVAYQFTDAKTGKLLASQVTPFIIAPQFDIALTPYFLQHQKLRVDFAMDEIPKTATAAQAQLQVDGKTLATQKVLLSADNSDLHCYLDTSKWPPQSAGKINAELVDADGKVLESDNKSLQRPANPSWWNQHVGMSQVVPPPFTPVKSTSDTASVWGRKYQLGQNGLPASIITRDAELLAAPITLNAEVNSKSFDAKSTFKRESQNPRDAIFESTRQNDAIQLTTKTTVHYDGAMRFDIQLSPKSKNARIDKLVLDIPVKSEWAKLFTHNSTYTSFVKNQKDGLGGALDQWYQKYSGGAMPFTDAFFLGYYDRGIQWFCPSDRGWSNADDAKVLSLVRENNKVILRVAIIDKPVNLSGPLDLNFGLMVTPIKSNPPRGKDLALVSYGQPSQLRKSGLENLAKDFAIIKKSGANLIGSYLSDSDTIFGQPWVYNKSDRDFLKQMVDEIHQAGLQYRPYSGWGVNTNIPEFNTFGKEMLKEPARNAGWGSYWMNPASAAWQDWWLGGAKDSAAQLGFDGMYLDGTIMPELTANELDNMGWRDAQGNLHGTYPVWALRDFLERLYILLHTEVKTNGVVDIHDGREPQYYMDSFADTSTSGEYHLKRGKTVLEVFSPEEFAAYYATYLQGNPRRHIWANWMKLPITQAEMRGMQLLHDTLTPIGAGYVTKYGRAYGVNLGYSRGTVAWVRLRLLRAHYANAEFLPYWDDTKAPLIESAPGGLLASAWVDPKTKRAMIAVVNLSDKPWKGTIKFNLQRLGVSPDAPLTDAMFNVPLNAKASQTLSVSIEEQRYRLFLLNDNLPIANPVKKDETEKSLPAVIP